MINEITSKNNQKIKYLCELKTPKGRNKYRQFLCEGKKALEMALKVNKVKEVYSLEVLKLPKDINQYIVSEEIMKKISSSVTPEGIVFVSDFIESKTDYGNKIVYLDGVSDPGNMGTIIRTALAFGYDSVFYSKGSVSPYNEKVVAASKGAIFLIPVIESELHVLKLKYQVIVSALEDNSISLKEVKPNNNFVLVLGNESHGVSKETLELADIVTKIPIQNIDSLNVAVAGAILMHDLMEK